MRLKKTFRQMVDEAKTRIDNVSVDELKKEMEQGDVLVLDIRDVRERWKLGSIPGAVHVPRGLLEAWADPETPYYRDFMQTGQRMILYCAGGGRSALAADVLQEMGYENVGHLEVGFNGWKDAGEPVEKVEPKI